MAEVEGERRREVQNDDGRKEGRKEGTEVG